MRWAQVMRLTGLNAEVLEPRLEEVAPLGLYHWGRVSTLVISRSPLGLEERAVKRAFDLTLVILAAPLVLLLVAVLAVLVRLETPGPAFFVQTRVGLNNRSYRCFKLRTMRSDSSDAAGSKSTERNDPRISRLGHFLRRTSLDELPQLWNVFKGDMSLVGPRPHALGSTAGGSLFWEVVPTYWSRHSMKPGLTGLAQVRGYRGATHNRRDLELRVASDMEYINSWSLWLDIKILLRSLLVLIHHNAY
jgi:lipopolysaccharide/colanic/teichoic acid biosynthesis glycosyltransferase